MSHYKKSSFLKETVSFISYLIVGVASCVFAFIVVVQFLTPSYSQDFKKEKEQSKGLKSIVKNIKNETKNVLKGDSSKKEKQETANKTSPQEEVPGPPSGELPPEALPSAPPSGELPPEDLPAAPPSGELPPEALPAAPPSGELPPEALPAAPPSGELPPEALPAPPSGELPPEALPAAPPSGELPTESQSEADLPKELKDEGIQDTLISEVEAFMSPFVYDPERRRDPFEDPTRLKEAENIIYRPKTPPEEYDLTQIQLKGIIWDTKSPKALFELPGSGGFYTLLRGDKVGKNGTIFEIREDEVVIVESIFKVSGSDTVRESEIKIIKLDRLKL